MPESSIVIKAEDRYSDAIKKMCDYTKRFSKDVDKLEDDLKTLSKNKYDLKLDLKQAQNELKAAEKQFNRTRSEADKFQLEAKQANYDNIRRNLEAVTKAAKDTERQIRNVSMGDSVVSGESVASSLTKSIKDAGFLKIGGDALSQALTFGLESALGQPLATAVNGALSSAVSGAAMGSIAGPMGAAIGGALGFVSGGISGIVTMEAAKDDAFKSYVQTSVEDQLSAMDQTLASGSATAGSREQSRLAFVQRFGSEDAADDYLSKVKTMARGTNYTYDEIVGYSKSLLNAYAPDEVFGVLQTLSDASAGLSLGESDVNVMIQGLSRMRTTGKATQEYLNYFSERGVDVYAALADAKGVDKSQIPQMISSGGISGEAAAQAILDYINETFGGLSENMAGTYDAMMNNLNDAQAEIDAAMGEGYNEARKSGIEEQQAWLDGESGEQVSEMYRSIGAFKASLENQKEALTRQYMDEAMEEI